MKQFSDFGITIPSGATGNIKTKCPSCTPHKRKPEHRNNKDLSVNIPQQIWNCHNCGWTGTLKVRNEKEYKKPVTVEVPLTEKTLTYFKKRGINENTLKFFGITEKSEWMPQEGKEMNCILFPYKRNGEWVNVKFRDGKKNFKLVKDAELIIFNQDAVFGKKRALITEGEIDCMAAHEVGFFECCSVPNGASKGNARLEYLDNSWQAFSECDNIIIATDNDEAGMALKKELVRRLGSDRCVEVEYPSDCKDLNEVLVKHGHSKVWECLNKTKPMPLEGIYRLSDFMFELDNVFDNGFPKGVTTGFSEFDKHINFSGGQVTGITGIPNSGKSAFLDQVVMKLCINHGWKVGLCSFENQPMTKHAANLTSLYSGGSFFSPDRKMSQEQYRDAKNFIHDHFFWFKMKDADTSINGILERAAQLVKTQGINALVIDPYNYIDHQREYGMSETEYISLQLTLLCNFAKENDIHIFIVAHPTKIKKDATGKFEVPTLYDISGSAHWFNKLDNGFTVYRDNDTNLVTVYIQKIRFFFNGKKGYAEFNYDVYNGRYKPVGDIEMPIPDNPHAGITKPNTLPIPKGLVQRDITQSSKIDFDEPF